VSKYGSDDIANVYVSLTTNGGNIKATARETNVPESTVRRWRDEWERSGVPQEVQELATKEAEDFAARAERVRDLALVEWERLVRAGEAKPKDLMLGIGILTDKALRARGLATTQVDHRLALPSGDEVAELLASFVGGVRALSDERQGIIDAEVVENKPKALSP
jgi:transposase-like protein